MTLRGTPQERFEDPGAGHHHVGRGGDATMARLRKRAGRQNTPEDQEPLAPTEG